LGLGAKTIQPARLHEIPWAFAASASVIGDPPCTLTLFSLPSAAKAIDVPSGDQAGGQNLLTPSVPATSSASSESSDRIQIPLRELVVAMNAKRVPSGDSANGGVRSAGPSPKLLPSGGSSTNCRELAGADGAHSHRAVKPPATSTAIAAVAMSAVIAAGLWRVGTLLQPDVSTPATSQIAEFTPVEDTDSDPEAHYTVAIARLEEVTRADGDVLDQETAGAMNAGLMVIDDAITESRAALRSEPQSESAQESLFAALRRKVALLQEMLALINEMRKGNQEGAARILSEINR